jgi:hypothetical protein
MSWLSNLKTSFALASFRLMKGRAIEVVEAFPSYAINRNHADILAKVVEVALAAVFWAGAVLGATAGIAVMAVIWTITYLLFA